MDPSAVPSLGLVPSEGTSRDLAELLSRAAGGDQSAFADLYDLTSSRVFGLAKRVVVDPAQAEEVAQEVYLEVWRSASKFDARRGGALAWMLTITHRRAVDRVRSAESAKDRDTKYASVGKGAEFDEVVDAVTATLEQDGVRRALASLTDIQREVIGLAYYEGHTYKEVSEMLNVPLGTVKTRMRDGLTRLREEMGVDQ